MNKLRTDPSFWETKNKAIEFDKDGNSFPGRQIPPQILDTFIRYYTINEINNDKVVIITTGTEVVGGDDEMQVKTTAYADREMTSFC